MNRIELHLVGAFRDRELGLLLRKLQDLLDRKVKNGLSFSIVDHLRRDLRTTQEIRRCVDVLDLRERIIVKLAILAGLRPGEIFGLTWDRMANDHVEIVQRVYRGTVDTPKTNQSCDLQLYLLVSPPI